jgi:hypothetical protein
MVLGGGGAVLGPNEGSGFGIELTGLSQATNRGNFRVI